MKALINGELVDMEPAEIAELEEARQVVIQFGPITRRQLRLTLLAHGVIDLVEPAIAALPEPQRSEALIEWQDASEYRRDHPLIEQIGTALALTAPEIDAMWAEALAR